MTAISESGSRTAMRTGFAQPHGRPRCGDAPTRSLFATHDPAGRRRASKLALLSFAMLIVSLDQYIVVVALPDIGRDLGYSAQTLQTVVSAYAVASSGFLLFGGRAADLLGRRRVLAAGLALYAIGSMAGGFGRAPRSSSARDSSRVSVARWSSLDLWP